MSANIALETDNALNPKMVVSPMISYSHKSTKSGRSVGSDVKPIGRANSLNVLEIWSIIRREFCLTKRPDATISMTKLPFRTSRAAGFSLIEMMVVIGIMSVMATITLVSFAGLVDKGHFGQDIFQIDYAFDQARAYALANNTYVFVGITEVDGSQLSTTSPQNPGNGRIAVAVVSSIDGTKIYDQGASYWQQNSVANLTPVLPLQYFDGLHMADFSSLAIPSSGGMDRPSVSSSYSLAASPSTAFTFNWPLTGGSTKYTFTKVIAFDPTGGATLLPANYTLASSGILTTMEIGLQPAHGSQIPALPTNIASGIQAAVQIDGVSGSVQLYQP